MARGQGGGVEGGHFCFIVVLIMSWIWGRDSSRSGVVKRSK